MEPIDPRRVSRGIITLDVALASRDATFVGVEETVTVDGGPYFIARAVVRSGGKLEAGSLDPEDAAERLLTLATRRPARSGFGW